jgi:hypothetical protein
LLLKEARPSWPLPRASIAAAGIMFANFLFLQSNLGLTDGKWFLDQLIKKISFVH